MLNVFDVLLLTIISLRITNLRTFYFYFFAEFECFYFWFIGNFKTVVSAVLLLIAFLSSEHISLLVPTLALFRYCVSGIKVNEGCSWSASELIAVVVRRHAHQAIITFSPFVRLLPTKSKPAKDSIRAALRLSTRLFIACIISTVVIVGEQPFKSSRTHSIRHCVVCNVIPNEN